VTGIRITSIIVVAALLSLAIWTVASGHAESATTADSGAPGNPAAAAEPVSPSGTTQRWSLLGGDRCEWVIRSTGEAAGSRGLSIECDANPDQQLVLQVDAKVQTGGWTLRVDDGEQSPNWLPLVGYPASRITGSKHYRFLIYSDDPRSEISIKDVAIRPAVDADYQLPLVWPTSGVAAEQDHQQLLPVWQGVFGIQDDSEFIARVKAITNFTYQRSNCQSDPEPIRNGTTADWIAVPSLQIYGSCGDFSNAMRMFCKKVGLKARMVNLATARFANGSARFDTHVLIEVFDSQTQRWTLADPTFNLVFEGPSGQPLGLKELLKIAADGKQWRTVPAGTLRPGRTIEDYYLKYADLLYAAYAPAVGSLGDSGAEFRTHELTIDEMGARMYPATVTP
jgi:hypothetical protein